MADRQTRRTLRRTGASANTSNGTVASNVNDAGNESGTIQNVDQRTDGNDSHANGESHESVRSGVNVITVDPNQLDEYIARDTATNGSGDGDGNSNNSGTKKRRGYTRRTTAKEKATDLTPVLDMVHTLAATVLHTPELCLSDEETKQLNEAFMKFSEHHEVSPLSAKRMSEVMLIGVALKVYGTRLVAIRNRKRAENETRKVVQMPIATTVTHGHQSTMQQ